MKKTFLVFAFILLASSIFNAVNARDCRKDDDNRYVNVIITNGTSEMKNSTFCTRAIKGINKIFFASFTR
jgi:hypothetical protein